MIETKEQVARGKGNIMVTRSLEVEVETELIPIELDQPLDEVMQEEYTTTPMSASAKKLRAVDVPVSIEPVECNVVINTHILTEFFITYQVSRM